jgi:hypothetical protein
VFRLIQFRQNPNREVNPNPILSPNHNQILNPNPNPIPIPNPTLRETGLGETGGHQPHSPITVVY